MNRKSSRRGEHLCTAQIQDLETSLLATCKDKWFLAKSMMTAVASVCNGSALPGLVLKSPMMISTALHSPYPTAAPPVNDVERRLYVLVIEARKCAKSVLGGDCTGVS
jgi:hypothetical protein